MEYLFPDGKAIGRPGRHLTLCRCTCRIEIPENFKCKAFQDLPTGVQRDPVFETVDRGWIWTIILDGAVVHRNIGAYVDDGHDGNGPIEVPSYPLVCTDILPGTYRDICISGIPDLVKGIIGHEILNIINVPSIICYHIDISAF